MSMSSIRDYYRVPARRGREIEFDGERTVILSADQSNMHLWIEWPAGSGKRAPIHPTWHVDYLDGEGVR
jgi:hypothetical protein